MDQNKNNQGKASKINIYLLDSIKSNEKYLF